MNLDLTTLTKGQQIKVEGKPFTVAVTNAELRDRNHNMIGPEGFGPGAGRPAKAGVLLKPKAGTNLVGLWDYHGGAGLQIQFKGKSVQPVKNVVAASTLSATNVKLPIKLGPGLEITGYKAIPQRGHDWAGQISTGASRIAKEQWTVMTPKVGFRVFLTVDTGKWDLNQMKALLLKWAKGPAAVDFGASVSASLDRAIAQLPAAVSDDTKLQLEQVASILATTEKLALCITQRGHPPVIKPVSSVAAGQLAAKEYLRGGSGSIEIRSDHTSDGSAHPLGRGRLLSRFEHGKWTRE